MQHNQFVVSTGTFWHHLLCESSLGFELAANVWVSHPVLNPLCNKWTPAARQTESDPALTTLLPPFYFWVAPSPPSPTMYKQPWGGPPAMRLFWWQMSRQSKYLAVVAPRWFIDWSRDMGTKAQFMNFRIKEIFVIAKLFVRFLKSISYLTSIRVAQLRSYLSIMSVITINKQLFDNSGQTRK